MLGTLESLTTQPNQTSAMILFNEKEWPSSVMQDKQNMVSRRKIKLKNTDSRFPAEQNLGAHTIVELNSGTHYKKLN